MSQPSAENVSAPGETAASRRSASGTFVRVKSGENVWQASIVDLGPGLRRMALVVTPASRGTFREQALEVIATVRRASLSSSIPLTLTCQTVFLRDPEDEVEFQRLMQAEFKNGKPLTTYVYQQPCDGAALAVEAWAAGGEDVLIEFFGQHAVAVSYDGLRWVTCGALNVRSHPEGVYAQTGAALTSLQQVLDSSGTGLENIVRTWFYLGAITDPDGETQRYKELNRARTDFYQEVPFHAKQLQASRQKSIYPASTGIGMQGLGLAAGCLTIQTDRPDALLLPLENPDQTPAYDYHPKYSPQSPKFSRAMAFVLKDYLTVWVSGTASIVDSESVHPGDPTRQTEQTLENIEKLISPENLAEHGVHGAGARLQDLAKVRVYVKRPEDFEAVQKVCRKRLGTVPAIYVLADVCRPELLVEIEGVAFSRRFQA